MWLTSYGTVKRKVDFVKKSNIEHFDESFSLFGFNVYRLRIQNKAGQKKTIERVVQVAEGKPQSSTTVEKHVFVGHEYDYIRANCDGTFYWNQDKSRTHPKIKWRQEITEGQILGYLDHFDGLYGNLITEVFSPYDGYILRTKVRSGQKVVKDDKLFLVYMKGSRKPKKPKKPKKKP